MINLPVAINKLEISINQNNILYATLLTLYELNTSYLCFDVRTLRTAHELIRVYLYLNDVG